MIDFYDYLTLKVRIDCKDGTSFFGYIIDVTDKGEYGEAEDSISLEEDSGRILGLYRSDIKEIVNID